MEIFRGLIKLNLPDRAHESRSDVRVYTKAVLCGSLKTPIEASDASTVPMKVCYEGKLFQVRQTTSEITRDKPVINTGDKMYASITGKNTVVLGHESSGLCGPQNISIRDRRFSIIYSC